MKKSSLPSLLFLWILLSGTSHSFGQKVINESFEGIRQIEINISSGDLLLEKSSDTKTYVAMTSSFEAYDPTIERRGSTLLINEDKMRNVRTWSGNINWSLRIPDGLEVRHNTGSGGVSVAGLRTDLDTKSGSGGFELADSEGEVKINTGSGDVKVTKSKGQFEFNCGSGDITLDNVTAELSCNTGSGDIEASGVSLTGKGSFNTGSGDAEVTLARALEHNISVNSGSGDAVLDFSGNKITGTVEMEADKDNGDIKAPFEFDSSEEIERGRNKTVKKTKKVDDSGVLVRVSTGSGTAELKAN